MQGKTEAKMSPKEKRGNLRGTSPVVFGSNLTGGAINKLETKLHLNCYLINFLELIIK